ncbi:type II toxin-antitoxin system Phd/YefM family antitoxin [Pantoea ananatis]|uniref:type II toxin-antitoxin system Phd/YefM family antitoxin n=1 Tax=Pantoea ananas TaxID=553 RepID=UPI001C37840B|nr:type II toxin-antitoxin system Phd/YefM family antitoxin [Pantoea ananatis]
MSSKICFSRAFNQDVTKAKKRAEEGPVYITDHDKPAHVLLTVEAYPRLTGGKKKLAMTLAMPETADVDFEPERPVITGRDAGF